MDAKIPPTLHNFERPSRSHFQPAERGREAAPVCPSETPTQRGNFTQSGFKPIKFLTQSGHNYLRLPLHLRHYMQEKVPQVNKAALFAPLHKYSGRVLIATQHQQQHRIITAPHSCCSQKNSHGNQTKCCPKCPRSAGPVNGRRRTF